jgi:hypothetical protein
MKGRWPRSDTVRARQRRAITPLPIHLVDASFYPGPQCCPGTDARRITRHVYEFAREIARELAKTRAYELSRRVRKKVEMLFAHLKRILQLSRLRLRGPAGAQFEFTFAAIAQNLRRLAGVDTARGPPDAAASVALVASRGVGL